MKYSADVLNQAEQILSERKKAAESEQRSREEYVFSNIPEAAMLQKRISSRYYSLIRLVANHDADAREKAEEYIKEQEAEGNYFSLYHLVDAQDPDREFSLKDKHYQRMEHCIGLDGGEVKDDLYKAYRNGVAYTECVPEWEDLVRNGYAKRTGELGQSIFYSLKRKGFEAVARRNRIRIRYEIEVG
jgi:hypothetical protein